MKYISEDALSEILCNFERDDFNRLVTMIDEKKDSIIFLNEEQIAFFTGFSEQ